MSSGTPTTLRPASSVVVVRPTVTPGSGLELLLLQRSEQGDQNSGAWVFPGGVVERNEAHVGVWRGSLTDAATSARLGLSTGGLDFLVAAVRECFEEAGLLLALDAQGGWIDVGRKYDTVRAALRERTLSFATFFDREALRIPVDDLAYIAHWVTPVGMPKRFDTRFFLAIVPPGQTVLHDGIEVVAHAWLSPRQILAPENPMRLLRVTRAIVDLLASFEDVATLKRWAQSEREVPCVQPRRCLDSRGPSTVLPDHPAYGELGLLDPLGTGAFWGMLRPDDSVPLFPGLQRVAGAGVAKHRYRIEPLTDDSDSSELRFDLRGEPLATPGAGLEPVPLPGGNCAWLLRRAGVLFAGPSLPQGAPMPATFHGVVRAIARGHGFLEPVE